MANARLELPNSSNLIASSITKTENNISYLELTANLSTQVINAHV